MIEERNKNNKRIYQTLTKRIKNMIHSFSNEKDVLAKREEI